MTNPAGAPASALMEKVARKLAAAAHRGSDAVWELLSAGEKATFSEEASLTISIVVEECAKVAGSYAGDLMTRLEKEIAGDITAAIRSLDSREG